MNQTQLVETPHKRYLIRSFNVEIVRDPEQKNPHALRDADGTALLARTMIPDETALIVTTRFQAKVCSENSSYPCY